jgi:hypothetical protein
MQEVAHRAADDDGTGWSHTGPAPSDGDPGENAETSIAKGISARAMPRVTHRAIVVTTENWRGEWHR